MKITRMLKNCTVGTLLTVVFSFTQINHQEGFRGIRMPYKKAGLNKRQAAAHLLNRFTFGPRSGDVDAVVNMGLESWLAEQLKANLNDTALENRLQNMDALQMSNESLVNTYLNQAQIIKLAIKNNVIHKDSTGNADKKEYKEKIKTWMDQQGLKQFQDLQTQLINQKILRASYSNNQLQEVLTDFWFNHFNVSLTKPQCQQFILPFERDAIRPHTMGDFKELLIATAKHPAMLKYLDNSSSVSNNNELSKRPGKVAAQKKIEQLSIAKISDTTKSANAFVQQAINARKVQGLNENYGREVMELHTLGVEGGYTQQDVTEVARALTGWSMKPMDREGVGRKIMDRIDVEKMQKQGFVTEGDFFYRADKHDDGEKKILGKLFPANGGYEEGMKVFEMLSTEPNTAKFICKKIAIHFVSDHPSDALVKEMAQTFLRHHGNITEVILTMVSDIEFWKEDAVREKIKSPFELAISAIRSTNAEVKMPMQIFNWCSRMGQRIYFYQAPTGFPDKASYWINTGSLLNRMNFGLAFATGKIPGVTLDLLALNQHHEPESAEEALKIYSHLLLPERNQDENIKRLISLIKDQQVPDKIVLAANNLPKPTLETDMDMMDSHGQRNERQQEKAMLSKKNISVKPTLLTGNNSTVAQVTGVIIGSPEFQRK